MDEFYDEFNYLTGYRSFPTITYKIMGGKVKRKWWFGYRDEYYIITDFWTWGPFKSLDEAKENLSYIMS